MQELGLEGHSIQPTRHGITVNGHLVDGFAPCPCFSTVALIHLLCMWGTCSSTSGGMRSAANKEAAIVLLTVSLTEAIGPMPVVIEVHADSHGRDSSQLLLKPCAPNLVMDAKHGIVDLTGWAHLAAQPLTCPNALPGGVEQV